MVSARLVPTAAALVLCVGGASSASAQGDDRGVSLIGVGGLADAVAPVEPALQVYRRYWEIPGVREFSGAMTVRPYTLEHFVQVYGGDEDMALRAYQAAAERVLQSFAVREYIVATDEYVIIVPEGRDENEVSFELMAEGLFAYAEPDWTVYPLVTPNDPSVTAQYHHGRIRSYEAWALETGSPEIVTAYVDTGYDLSHPDLVTQYVSGFNSVDRVSQIDGGDISDINGHGTSVAGTGAARGNNGIGISGVGWNLGVMPVRTSNISSGSASLSDILAGARWAIENGANTASCSYSGVDSGAIQSTGAYISGLGGLLLYAAGNDNRNLNGFDHQDVIVVGSSTASDSKSGFSAFGPGVDIFAPGSAIRTTQDGGGYTTVSGTSFATPMANGLLGLIWSVDPDGFTNENVRDLLYENAFDLGREGEDDFWGHGRIDAAASIAAAIASQTPAAPDAGDDNAVTVDVEAVEIDVLSNDRDVNFDALTIVAFDPVSSAGGSVELVGSGPDQRLRYTPAPGTADGPGAPHTFMYTVDDGVSGADTAVVSVTVFDTSEFLDPVGRPSFTNPGLNAAWYLLDTPSVLPDFDTLEPESESPVPTVFWPSTAGPIGASGASDNFGFVLTGYIDVPEDDRYTLYIESDDGSRLFLHDQLLVDNDGLHAMRERSGQTGLRAGLHPIRIEFFERDGGAGLIVSIEGGGLPKRDIPIQWMVREAEPPAVTACNADFNSSGIVDTGDLVALLGVFNRQTLRPFDPGDTNGDSSVDTVDLLSLLSFFGQSCAGG